MCWPWDPLFFLLIAFDHHLQAEWVISSAVIIQVIMWHIAACKHGTKLHLVHLRSSWFGVCMLLLVAHACEMAKHMASFALILLGRTLESLHVDCVTTFGASVPVMVCTLCVRLLLLLHLWFVIVATLVFVVSLFGLPEWSFLLVFTGWQLCALLVDPLPLVLYGT